MKNQCHKKKGFTLIEIMIATFISAIILTVILTIFSFGRKAYDYSEYSHTIAEDTYFAIQWLRKDLQQTSLGTIRSYPNADYQEEKPGASFESAIGVDSGTFELTDFGTPNWSNHVFYRLEESGTQYYKGRNLKVADLVRLEVPIPSDKTGTFPYPTDTLPSNADGKNKRVILRDVIMNGQDLDGNGEKDEYHGFRLWFVRKDKDGKEILSEYNPAQVSSWGNENQRDSLTIEGNTELVKIEMTVLQASGSTGEANISSMAFKVMPRN